VVTKKGIHFLDATHADGLKFDGVLEEHTGLIFMAEE
jgi:hypothetical protein